MLVADAARPSSCHPPLQLAEQIAELGTVGSRMGTGFKDQQEPSLPSSPQIRLNRSQSRNWVLVWRWGGRGRM